MRLLSSAALVALLASCSAAPPPEPVAAPVASAAPPPVVETATAAPTAAPSAAPVTPPSPYFPVIVRGAQRLSFHPLTAGAVVIDGYSTPILIDQKGARIEPTLTAGLKGGNEAEGGPSYLITRIGGDWPRSGALELNIPGDRGGTDVDYTWSGSTWIKAKDQPMDEMPAAASMAYYQGGLFGSALWGGHPVYSVISEGPPRFVLGRHSKAPLPIMAKGKAPCPTRLVGYALLAALPGGDLLGVGKLCTSADDYPGFPVLGGRGALAIERWRKGSAMSVVEVLAGSEDKGEVRIGGVELLALSPTDLYVAVSLGTSAGDRPYLVHGDGKAWTEITPPTTQAISKLWTDKEGTLWAQLGTELQRRKGGAWERLAPAGAPGDIQQVWRAPDGTHWARFGKDLWHLDAGGAWEKAILPPDAKGNPRVAADVGWLGPGNMMIVAEGDGDNVLLATVKPDRVFDAQADHPEAARAPAPPARKVGPPTPGCKNLFAVLYKLSRVAPPDFDFPLTREALKGHTEFSDVRFAETEDAGSRYLVAFVPSLARGQKLLAVVRDKVQGARPQLLCGDPPKQNRALSIDLRTGALKK